MNDENLTYYGRWLENGEGLLAQWNAPYIRFNFTGTSLMADFEGRGTVYVYIDGVAKYLSDAEGKIVLANNLSEGVHEAKIEFRGINGKTGINAIYVDENAEISCYNKSRKHIQFIGDSITTDGRSYSYTIPKEYNLDYSIISMSGLALQDGSGWYYSSKGISKSEQKGMESAYFMKKSPKDAYVGTAYMNEEASWQNNAPDVIVIGLGTNDVHDINNNVEGLSASDFTASYIDFVTKLAEEFSGADIYILRQFNHSYGDYEKLREATYAAYAALSEKYSNVKYIDTSDWNVEIDTDEIHPTAGGYSALRDLIYNEIKDSLK